MDGNDYSEETNMVETLDLSIWPDSNWEMSADQLPYTTMGNSAGFCTEAVTGGEIWSVGGATIAPDMIFDINVYHPTGKDCLQNIVNLPDAPMQGYSEIGNTAYYTLAITNTGNVIDYYNLTISTTWSIDSPVGGPGPVGPGETIEVVINIDVPQDANIGDIGISTVRIESLRDPNIMDSILITTTVVPTYDVDLAPESIELSGVYGEIITYTLTVSNMGNITDTISLTYTGNTWEVWLPVTSIDLGIGESAEFVITVIVPLDAWPGDSDQLVLTATSLGNTSVSANATLITTALWHRMLLPLAMKE